MDMKKLSIISGFILGAFIISSNTFAASFDIGNCKKKSNHKSIAESYCNSTQQEGYYTQYYGNKPELIKQAKQWYESGEWRNGFDKADADSSVNLVDFYLQYQKNPAQWRALFKFISKTDLLTIPKGRHSIPGTSLVVSVEDSENAPLEKRSTESHYHHIDFQYVVKGVERFGIIDHYTSKANSKYRPDVIHYNYDVSRTRFYDSQPNKFFIFFPGDWHIAKVNNDTDNQSIRVIVIKVDYLN